MIMCMQEKPEIVPVSMKLENLTSYYKYTVSVVACTTACSEKSPPVTVQTDIGGMLLVHYMFLGDIIKSFLICTAGVCLHAMLNDIKVCSLLFVIIHYDPLIILIMLELSVQDFSVHF
jgi:hypothetical protein